MKRSDLIQNLSTKFTPVPEKVIGKMVATVFDEIGNSLAEGKSVQLRNYMLLSTKENMPTKRRNPKTGETFILSSRNHVVFKPGRAMKESVKMYKGFTT